MHGSNVRCYTAYEKAGECDNSSEAHRRGTRKVEADADIPRGLYIRYVTSLAFFEHASLKASGLDQKNPMHNLLLGALSEIGYEDGEKVYKNLLPLGFKSILPTLTITAEDKRNIKLHPENKEYAGRVFALFWVPQVHRAEDAQVHGKYTKRREKR